MNSDLMQKESYKLIIDSEKEPSIFDSKLGGLPYWDFDSKVEYPVDFDGNRMQLLAQINFAEAFPSDFDDERLPKSGLLQFFIAADHGSYGFDFSDLNVQKNFRIVYHESVNTNVTKERIEKENLPQGFDELSTPIVKECAISFEKSETDEVGSGMFVKPSFTQEEPSEIMENGYDTVLLQLDSSGYEDYFMWGDEGIGNFFIHECHLKEKNFSDVLYNWDCC